MRMRVVAIGLATSLAGLAMRSDSRAQPAPDLTRAKQLYDAGSSELAIGAFDDAIRDLGAAAEITKDPVLFFKLAEAYERAGHCETALGYYARYLREAKPSQHYIDVTAAHVAACGGDWSAISGPPPAPALGSAGSGSPATGAETGPAAGAESGPATGADQGSGAGSAMPGPLTVAHPTNDLPWLMVGGALAFVTAGAVFAYSATASQNDIKDLYVGVSSTAPLFDAMIAKRYQDLLDEGHRYQYLSLASFGVATGFAVTAALLFVHDHNEQQRRLLLTPTAGPSGAGVSATLHF